MFGYSVRDFLLQVVAGVLSTAITGGLAWAFNANPATIFIWCLCAFGAGLVVSNQLLLRKTLQKEELSEVDKTPRNTTSRSELEIPPEKVQAPAQPVLVTAGNKEERVFVGENITAEYLMNLFREPGRTTYQGRTLVAPYIGKWMQVSGVMSDVKYTPGSSCANMSFERDSSISQTNWRYYARLSMYFHSIWIQRVLILRQGDPVIVIGQIEKVNGAALELENCELIDSHSFA